MSGIKDLTKEYYDALDSFVEQLQKDPNIQRKLWLQERQRKLLWWTDLILDDS
ncbi:MAG: hypothetical protein ACFFBD_12160 [Candidatus Hodarchaeota archaeon]